MAADQLDDIRALRTAMGQLSDQEFDDMLGDQRTTMMYRNDVVGTKRLIWGAAISMILYMIFSTAAFMIFFDDEKASSGELAAEKASFGEKVADGVYYSSVTLSTTGYGDLVPKTPSAKSFGATVSILSNNATGEMLARLLRSHPLLRNICAAATLVVLIFGGAEIALHLDSKSVATYPNALYFAITSVTSVGYGDIALKGTGGRIFVSFWLFASSLLFQRTLACVLEILVGWVVKLAVIIAHTQRFQQFRQAFQNLPQRVHNGCGGCLTYFQVSTHLGSMGTPLPSNQRLAR